MIVRFISSFSGNFLSPLHSNEKYLANNSESAGSPPWRGLAQPKKAMRLPKSGWNACLYNRRTSGISTSLIQSLGWNSPRKALIIDGACSWSRLHRDELPRPPPSNDVGYGDDRSTKGDRFGWSERTRAMRLGWHAQSTDMPASMSGLLHFFQSRGR
jgi:hypothetical protein